MQCGVAETMASEEVMRLLLKHSLLDAATWYTVAPHGAAIGEWCYWGGGS